MTEIFPCSMDLLALAPSPLVSDVHMTCVLQHTGAGAPLIKNAHADLAGGHRPHAPQASDILWAVLHIGLQQVGDEVASSDLQDVHHSTDPDPGMGSRSKDQNGHNQGEVVDGYVGDQENKAESVHHSLIWKQDKISMLTALEDWSLKATDFHIKPTVRLKWSFFQCYGTLKVFPHDVVDKDEHK